MHPSKVRENMCCMVIQYPEKWPAYAKHLCIWDILALLHSACLVCLLLLCLSVFCTVQTLPVPICIVSFAPPVFHCQNKDVSIVTIQNHVLWLIAPKSVIFYLKKRAILQQILHFGSLISVVLQCHLGSFISTVKMWPASCMCYYYKLKMRNTNLFQTLGWAI